MILSDIKRYLMERRQATLADLALHFDADADAMRGMLQQWVRKGRVTKVMAGGGCGSSCSKCDPAAVEIYVWNDAAGNVPGTRREFPLLGPHCSR